MPIGRPCTEEIEWVQAKFQEPGSMTEDRMEAVFAEAIRRAADRDPQVGRNLVSIMTLRNQRSRVRYLPDPLGPSPDFAYTPWIIGPSVVMPPQKWQGEAVQSLVAGSFEVRFDGVPMSTTAGANITSSEGHPPKPFPSP